MWVPNTIPEVLAVFLDIERKKEWIPRLWENWAKEDPKVLGKRVEYGEVLVPWPFHNRDVLVQIETQVIDNINNVRLLAYSIDNEKVIDSKCVRAVVHPSDLILIYDEKKKETLLETISFTDPRGYIPDWIVNLFQKSEAKELAEGLRRQLEKKLYKKEELKRIQDGLREILKRNR